MSGYGCFAAYYDRLTSDIDYKARAKYFHRIIQRYLPSANIVVDLACGTGSLSIELEQFGYDLIAIEGSRDMLSIAVSKMNAGHILYLCQDMREIDLYGTVDVVICALDSLNHFIDLGDLQKVFERVSLFLDPNGLFIFDVNTLYKHEKILAENSFIIEDKDLFCAWQNSACVDHIVDIKLDFFLKSGKNYTRQTEIFSERAYTKEELQTVITNAGLKVLQVFHEDSFEKPRADSQRLIYIVGKAEGNYGENC